jgi:hypothetical protein
MGRAASSAKTHSDPWTFLASSVSELEKTVHAFDSTTIDLCLTLYPWTFHTSCAIKPGVLEVPKRNCGNSSTLQLWETGCSLTMRTIAMCPLYRGRETPVKKLVAQFAQSCTDNFRYQFRISQSVSQLRKPIPKQSRLEDELQAASWNGKPTWSVPNEAGGVYTDSTRDSGKESRERQSRFKPLWQPPLSAAANVC